MAKKELLEKQRLAREAGEPIPVSLEEEEEEEDLDAKFALPEEFQKYTGSELDRSSFVKWKKNLVLAYFIGVTAILIILNYNRFLNHSEEHLYTFNNKKKTIVVRQASENICFYTDKEDAEYLMNNYLKIYPGDVRFLELRDGEYFFEDKGMKIFSNGKGKDKKVYFENSDNRLDLNSTNYYFMSIGNSL